MFQTAPKWSAQWTILILSTLIALAAAKPYAGGWNDGSRLAAVEALVDHQSLAIDRSIFVAVPQTGPSPYADDIRQGTQDKLLIGGHWYSDKPYVPAFLMAVVYAVFQILTDLTARHDPGWFCYLMTVASSGLAYVVAVVSVDRLALALRLPTLTRWLLTGSFSLGTIALIYVQHANGHVLLLGIASLLVLHLVGMAQDAAAGSWRAWRLLLIGTLVGLGYCTDQGLGMPLVVASGLLVAYRCRSVKGCFLVALGALPWLALHHAVTYTVGGTWRPLNAVPDYLAWPGSPFVGKLATGSFQHGSVLQFLLYTTQLLIGKKGFLLHNLPVLLIVPGLGRLLLRQSQYRPEVLWALAWCGGGVLAYALASANYSGVCCSIRWFVPLLAPLYLAMAVHLDQHPESTWDLAWLSLCGIVLMALAWPGGTWSLHMVPGYWGVAGVALLGWCVGRRIWLAACDLARRDYVTSR